jgi:hypothetical protein
LLGFRWHARALDPKGEEVVAGPRGGFDQHVRELLFARLPIDVDVARRSGAVECNPLPIAREL